MTIHLYSIINVIFISLCGQEIKFFLSDFKRKLRLTIYIVLSLISFVGVIIFDLVELHSYPTLIFDIVLSVSCFMLMFLRNPKTYKVMQRASKKKEVKKLNLIFYIICVLIIILPFIALIIVSLIAGKKNFAIPSNYVLFVLVGLLIYCLLAIFIIFKFAQVYNKHYLQQLKEDEENCQDV